MAALHLLGSVDAHVVTQIVEAHLVIGTVGDVGGIGLLPLFRGQTVNDQTYLQTQEAIDLAHPFGVALCQVVVHGNHVDAVACQSVKVGGKSRHQGFAFTGFHFGNASLMQNHTAHQLHPIGTQSQNAVSRLADGSERLRQKIVQRFAVCKALAELYGFGAQLFVGEGFVLLTHRFDLVHNGIDLLKLPAAVIAENLLDETHIC